MSEEADDDDCISKKDLTATELRAIVGSVCAYLERIVNSGSHHSPKWACVMTEEPPPPENNDKLTLRATTSTGAYAIVVGTIKDLETIELCVGVMHSPLLLPDTPALDKLSLLAADDPPLLTFSELMDYMIVHLCPAMCAPRALYYIINSMKLCLPPKSVDAQLTIREKHGEFVLRNTQTRQKCGMRLSIIDDASGEPTLYYYEKSKKLVAEKRKKLPTPSASAGLPLKGFDFVQHAFRRDAAVEYIQHPHVTEALTAALTTIGLAGLDTGLRKDAEALLRQTRADYKKKE